MVWSYGNSVNHMKDFIIKYSEVFENIWSASCFKGATNPSNQLTPINKHIDNNYSWLLLLKSIKSMGISTNFRGIALTGWSR